MRALNIVGSFTLLAAACAHAQSPISRDAADPLVPEHIVGSEGKGYFTGAGIPDGNMPIYSARDGAVPAGIAALPVDIFTTRDFYKDTALWMDPRYYRCNSAVKSKPDSLLPFGLPIH
jgi:hypothetical protein